jgi:hypothetical protein
MYLIKLLKNDKAVSVSIGFILMFTVTVLVFVSLIISFHTLSQHTEKSATRESFKIIGEGLANKIASIDTLINTTNSYSGSVNELEYEFSMPESIASKSYSINISNSTNQITLETDSGARSVAPFNSSTNFIGRKIYSGAGNYQLIFDKNTRSIYIEEY